MKKLDACISFGSKYFFESASLIGDSNEDHEVGKLWERSLAVEEGDLIELRGNGGGPSVGLVGSVAFFNKIKLTEADPCMSWCIHSA